MEKIDVGMIQKEFDVIEKANALFESSLDGETLAKTRRVMVDCRRKLKKEKYALGDNPAAALYGESQVGKSYLIGSLLSVKGEPFCITDGTGKPHNFIENINPPGGGSESTSIVSRFSVNYEPVNPNFPIKAVLLSPADIVLVLCDSFYNDIKTDHGMIIPEDDIVSEINSLRERLKDRRRPQQVVLDEDDVWDMRDYFNENFSQKASNVLNARFFDEMAPLISAAGHNEWKDIFSILWNKNEKFTNLFAALVSEYEKLNFSGEVYLPMESVLYKHGTLLDVNRLREIFGAPEKTGSEYRPNTKVLLPDKNLEIEFPKSYLCALAAELRFGLEKTLRNSKGFLNKIDLLDFPGARARMTLPQNEIKDENIPELLKRGKVAYLFNKFSDTKKISILMLCARNEQTGQRSMPEMLNNWINKYVGKTPEKRESFIKNSKISPLFIVGTFFNCDLEYNPLQDREDNVSSLNYRWAKRFDIIFAVELLNTETYDWFNNWTTSDKDFKNFFLLRDFNYSESKSQLFRGFREHKKEMEEVDTPSYPGFRDKLRQSFIEYPFVRRHFENPEESWDSAAKINCDGAEYIIGKLKIAAEHIYEARLERNRDELNEISQTVLAELKKYFHCDDKDVMLQKAKNTVGKIRLKMDKAFGGDDIKQFGLMMKELMIDESSVYRLYHEILNDIEHSNQRNTDSYSILKMKVPPEENEGVDAYFERARAHYDQTAEEFRAYLEANRIDLADLLSGGYMIKDDARMLAEALLKHWLDYVQKTKLPIFWRVLSESDQPNPQDPPALLLEIAVMYRRLFEKMDVAERIAEKILRYTNKSGRAGKPYQIIADISAEYLNRFVGTVGFEHLDKSAIDALRRANENANKENTLGLNFDRDIDAAGQTVEELFTKIHNLAQIVNKNPKELETLPSYRRYLLWSDRLKIGFVYACDIPTYDPAVNNKLGEIIKTCEAVGRY